MSPEVEVRKKPRLIEGVNREKGGRGEKVVIFAPSSFCERSEVSANSGW